MKLGEFIATIGLALGIFLVLGSLGWLWDLANWLNAGKAWTFCIYFYLWCLSDNNKWSILFDLPAAGLILGLLISIISSFWIGYSRE